MMMTRPKRNFWRAVIYGHTLPVDNNYQGRLFGPVTNHSLQLLRNSHALP